MAVHSSLLSLCRWYPPQSDRSTILAAVSQNGMALEFASTYEKQGLGLAWVDQEVVLAAVRQNGMALQFAGPMLQTHVMHPTSMEAVQADRAVVVAAVQQNSSALQFAPEALQADVAVLDATRTSTRRLR